MLRRAVISLVRNEVTYNLRGQKYFKFAPVACKQARALKRAWRLVESFIIPGIKKVKWTLANCLMNGT